jgi:leucyl aminopeptidase
MPFSAELSKRLPEDVEAVGVPVFSDGLDEAGPDLDWAFLANRGFEGRVGESQAMPGGNGEVLIALGLGRRSEVDAEALRRAGGALARAASRLGTVATTLLDAAPEGLDPARGAQAIVEGVSLAAYRFHRYKSDPRPSNIERLVLVGGGGKRVQAGIERGQRVAEAVAFARDLINEPGGTLTPRAMAEAAVDLAARENLGISVLDEVDIEAAGLGGLLGVNRGSTEPPRFIELSYEPEGARATVALVGKGITFDSGGLSIKPADGMITMKTDMAGGAAVLGAMSAVASVAPRLRVLAYIPATDNMTGGDATRPGDVLKIRNGKTIEILNTDAEGRLVLADALSVAAEQEPDAIVDLATLTGACRVALGDRIAGVMGNNDELIDQLRAASDRSGERIWPLPLPKDYRRQIDSEVADMKNTGGRYAGALTAGLLLQEFVDDRPWAHLDIAGPSRSDEDEGYLTKGGTGFGVRLLLDFLSTFKKPKRG